MCVCACVLSGHALICHTVELLMTCPAAQKNLCNNMSRCTTVVCPLRAGPGIRSGLPYRVQRYADRTTDPSRLLLSDRTTSTVNATNPYRPVQFWGVLNLTYRIMLRARGFRLAYPSRHPFNVTETFELQVRPRFKLLPREYKIFSSSFHSADTPRLLIPSSPGSPNMTNGHHS